MECMDGVQVYISWPATDIRRIVVSETVKDVATNDTAGSRIRTEYMMGHQGMGSLDKNYYKTDVLELAADYVRAVPDPTINDTDRMRLTNKRLSDNIKRMESEKDMELAAMMEEMARMKEDMDLRDRRMALRDRRMALRDREIADLSSRRGPPGTDLVDALKGAAGTDGVPGRW